MKSKTRKRSSDSGKSHRKKKKSAASAPEAAEAVALKPAPEAAAETAEQAAQPTTASGAAPEPSDTTVLPDATRADLSAPPAASDRPEAAPVESETILELLAFRLADEEYAIDILSIKEIIRSVEITSVPKTRPFIKGIISLRGMIIPVFDLRTRLGLAESSPDRATRILVVALEKGLIGLIADQVTEVVKVRSSRIEPPPTTGGGSLSGHLKGVTRVNGRLLILLDLERALAID